MRFGDLNDASNPIRTTTQVAHKLNLNVTTVINVCKRFVLNGNTVVSRRRFSGRRLSDTAR